MAINSMMERAQAWGKILDTSNAVNRPVPATLAFRLAAVADPATAVFTDFAVTGQRDEPPFAIDGRIITLSQNGVLVDLRFTGTSSRSDNDTCEMSVRSLPGNVSRATASGKDNVWADGFLQPGSIVLDTEDEQISLPVSTRVSVETVAAIFAAVGLQ